MPEDKGPYKYDNPPSEAKEKLNFKKLENNSASVLFRKSVDMAKTDPLMPH